MKSEDDVSAQAREFRTQIGALQDAVLRHERDILQLKQLIAEAQKLMLAIDGRLNPLEKRERQYVR